MNKKIPLRRCIATGEQCAKKDLIRVVKNKEGEVFIDLQGRQNGRGAYLKSSIEALEICKKKNFIVRRFLFFWVLSFRSEPILIKKHNDYLIFSLILIYLFRKTNLYYHF